MNHVAYSGFSATIAFSFRPSMSFVPDVERTVKVEQGDQSELESTPTIDETVELKNRPPNKVREEADLPQPVLVTDEKGNSREEWKRVVKKSPAQKVPHNRVMGAI